MSAVHKESNRDLRQTDIDPDYWYPVCLSRELRKGKVRATTFRGDPIAVYRSASGQAWALEDRCAHRQFPLSCGVVCGEQLQCGYHAWRYEPSGRIAQIPYLVKGAKPPRSVRGYPCREACGFVFVFPGAPDRAERVPLPDLPLFDTADYKPMHFFSVVNCHYTFMHENLMDMNHQFLHRRLMGSIKPQLLGTSKGTHWVEAQYHFEHQGGRKHRGVNLMAIGGDADEKDYDVMTIRTVYPYQTLTIAGRNSARPSLSLWSAYVPKDREGKSCHSFGVLLLKKPRVPWVLNVVWPVLRHFTESVFAEDRMAVEAEQQAYDRQGADWNQEIFPVLLDLRALLLNQGRPVTENVPLRRGC